MKDVVAEFLLELARHTWAASTSEQDADACYDRVLGQDMVVVLPGMVLERDEAMASWSGSSPCRDFEIEDVRTMTLGRHAAPITCRATTCRAKDTASYRALCTSVYHSVEGRRRLAFQQQTPLSDSVGCGG